MSRLRPSQPGYALIELVVALAVLAVMAAATVPALGLWLDREPGPSEEVATLLRSARAEALSSARQVTLVLDPGTGRWLSERGDRPAAKGTLSLREGSIDSDADRLVFSFTPGGGSAGGLISVRERARVVVVRVRAWTGEVTIDA